MRVCDNIFSLSNSMTRIEKYREYRQEISNMKFETFSQKREVSHKVGKVHDSDLGSKLNYEQVMNIHEVYDSAQIESKRNYHFPFTKYEIFYYLFALSFIAVMIVALILVGINQWR